MVLTDAGFKTALDGKVGSGYLHVHIANTLSLFLEGGSTADKE